MPPLAPHTSQQGVQPHILQQSFDDIPSVNPFELYCGLCFAGVKVFTSGLIKRRLPSVYVGSPQ